MAKTATSRKAEAKTKAKNGVDSKASPTSKNGNADFAIVEMAKAEYVKRRKSQLEAIKKTDKKLLRAMLYQMVLGRRFEEKCAEVYRMGKIGGFCHLYIGQEAVAVGSLAALRPDDYITCSYR